MKPLKLKRTDYNNIEQALVKFYSERPDKYGLYERNQEEYEKYF